MLLQTCGVDMSAEPAGRIVFTRVGGVSCGLIPQGNGAERSYRVWCDYTLAPALWETLCSILAEHG
jgi:sarcosine oxidase gamma subunit